MGFSMVFKLCSFLAAFMLASAVRGDVPKVSTDIAPVHSLVAMVMNGVGKPDLIVTPGASPHGYALRPSQADALQGADLVVWIGPELTPWLSGPIETLAANSERLELLEVPGTHLLAIRDMDMAQEAGHDHADHSGVDPHAWLDPENGRTWLAEIAGRLAELDPDNASQYRANAAAGQAELVTLQAELSAQLSPMQGQPYVTFHDAYQYFEAQFGLTPTGAVTASDPADPGPAGLARLRDELTRTGATCAFTEPQFNPGLLYAATGRDDLKIIPLDPMGSHQPPGPGLYPGVLRDMGQVFASCADP